MEHDPTPASSNPTNLRGEPSASTLSNPYLAMSQDSVSIYVASLCSAYHDGAELVRYIKAKKDSRKTSRDASISASAQELESSLLHGENAVRNQYERTYERCGDAFAQGDQIARDALLDNITHLQRQVIANLKAHGEEHKFVDFTALQDICDSIQDRAILVLMQLQQRTITLSSVDSALPLNPLGDVSLLPSPPQNTAQPLRQNISTVTVSSSLNTSSVGDKFFHGRKLSSSPSVGSITPPGTPNASRYSPRPDSARGSRERTNSDRRAPTQYKPMATTVTTTGLFGIGKRTKVEPVINPPENPLVDEYLAVAIEDANNGLSSNASIISRTESVSTSVSSIYEAAHPAFNSWQDYRSSSPAFSERPLISIDTLCHAPGYRFSGSIKSFDSQRRASAATLEILSSDRSMNSINPKDLLPSETNKYAGFCEGAWRQQLGDQKRAMEQRVRPGGMYNAAKYYQCKQCKFEGRLTPTDKKKSGFDMRVFKLVQGIQFRWEFMFKSHIQAKEACSDPTKATFGCIFCCAEGKGTPMFGGIQTFMNHLVEHRENFPTGDVLYRMNCLVGRQATVNEDFDINIISI